MEILWPNANLISFNEMDGYLLRVVSSKTENLQNKRSLLMNTGGGGSDNVMWEI